MHEMQCSLSLSKSFNVNVCTKENLNCTITVLSHYFIFLFFAMVLGSNCLGKSTGEVLHKTLASRAEI